MRLAAQDDRLLASAADWALLLTGRLVRWRDEPSPLKHIVARLGEPVVRAAVRPAMRILAEQFGLAYAPTYSVVFTFVIMVLALAFRPRGIMGRPA